MLSEWTETTRTGEQTDAFLQVCDLQQYLALIPRITWRIRRPFHGFLIIQRDYEYATKPIKNYVTYC
jgi:hypothetical protein